MRKLPAIILVLAATIASWSAPGEVFAWHGWHGWRFHWHARTAPGWVLIPASPIGPGPAQRLHYPPGLALSFSEPATGATYCLSQTHGLYFVCGYSRPVGEAIEIRATWPPPPVEDAAAPEPSGVLLFQLPPDAEATVNGEPVGLTGGAGAAAVPPGRHRLVVRASGQATERTVTVAPRAILTVTPTGITPPDH